MGENTAIEWADHTFNPWIGCQKVSPACDGCYAETLMDTRLGRVEWGPHGERKRTSEANWRQPRKWDREAGKSGKRARVFCASLADVFDNKVPGEWRADLWQLIDDTPHLIWMLLTKRPQNIAKMLPIAAADFDIRERIWLGTTAENQEEYDRRWPYIAAQRAAVRFVSYEPALGPLCVREHKPRPDWLICGGESGPNARPMTPYWASALQGQCTGFGIPFFFKQWGEWAPITQTEPSVLAQLHPATHIQVQLSAADNMARVGKKRAGRLLDGREWNEVPA